MHKLQIFFVLIFLYLFLYKVKTIVFCVTVWKLFSQEESPCVPVILRDFICAVKKCGLVHKFNKCIVFYGGLEKEDSWSFLVRLLIRFMFAILVFIRRKIWRHFWYFWVAAFVIF